MKTQTQTQLSMQFVCNQIVLDSKMRAVACCEKLALGTHPNKKYGYYDENDTASFKTEDQIREEVLITKECLQTVINLYKKDFKGKPLKEANNLSDKEIVNDLIQFKNIATQRNRNYGKYYDDIINLIKGKSVERYTTEEILSEDINPVEMDEKRANYIAYKLLNGNSKANETIKKHKQNLEESDGKFIYVAHLNEKPGRERRNYKKHERYENFPDTGDYNYK